MQSDAIQPGQTVIIVDDLIATGMLQSFVGRRRAKSTHPCRRFSQSRR